jgi:hypothetical protein
MQSKIDLLQTTIEQALNTDNANANANNNVKKA